MLPTRLCRIVKCLQESCTDCWFSPSWVFSSPWYMRTFSLHCNHFSSIKQFPEGMEVLVSDRVCVPQFPKWVRCLVGLRFPEEQRKKGPYLRRLPYDTHWGLSFSCQTNVLEKQHVHSTCIASTHHHSISTVVTLFKEWIHDNSLKVFKRWQIGQQRKGKTLQASFQSHEIWGLWKCLMRPQCIPKQRTGWSLPGSDGGLGRETL